MVKVLNVIRANTPEEDTARKRYYDKSTNEQIFHAGDHAHIMGKVSFVLFFAPFLDWPCFNAKDKKVKLTLRKETNSPVLQISVSQ
jgi:hypothetical protein